MFKILLFVFWFGLTNAKDDAQMKLYFSKQMLACATKYKVQTSDLLQLEKLVLPKNPEAKCLLGCFYKHLGNLNSKGMYDLKGSEELIAKLNPEADKKKLALICAKVNDVKVSDGEKGCERAVLLFKCNAENKEKFGLNM